MKDPRLTPDCGPHCKRVTRTRFGGVVSTQDIKHCRKRRCTLCHKKPIPKKT